jgi:hypothetical protein
VSGSVSPTAARRRPRQPVVRVAPGTCWPPLGVGRPWVDRRFTSPPPGTDSTRGSSRAAPRRSRSCPSPRPCPRGSVAARSWSAAPASSAPPGPGAGRARGGTLELLHESPGVDVLNYPDAVAASPQGTLVVCEDGPGTTLLRGLTARGEIFPIAHAVDRVNDVTGPAFSPDGRTLFFNLMGEDPPYEPGMSFVVWGPWHRCT